MSIKRPIKSPSVPGIYFFRRADKILYIGKAANLKKRLLSYFRKNVSPKVERMKKEATKLDWLETESEIEALLQEAGFIKRYYPKYNILMRDDKSYFYVEVTREKFPRIFITHQPLHSGHSEGAKRPKNLKRSFARAQDDYKKVEYMGPFTSGTALKIVLKLLRKIFPYCTCKDLHKRPCLNMQIGRCPGYCCLKLDLGYSNVLKNIRIASDTEKGYRKNVQNIIAVLSGRKMKILRGLKKEMKSAVKTQEFEKAAKIRDQIQGLENIFGHRQLLEVRLPMIRKWRKIEKNLQVILGITEKISRVEGYDISNISGTAATGSMVVFVDGVPAKSEYRKFKIKTVRGISDVDMLKEVIRRRMAHKEWPYPELMLIDGGRPQLNAAAAALSCNQLLVTSNRPAVVALAKQEEELYIERKPRPIKLSTLSPETAFFFQRVRDEAHRFAKKYHHKLREKSFKSDTG